MKILLLDVCSHTGSTGKIVFGAYNYYKSKGHEVMVCYSGERESKMEDQHFVGLNSLFDSYYSAFMTRITGYEGLFNRKATKKLIKVVEEFKPDFVQISSLHGYFLNHFEFLEYLKKKQMRTLYLMVDQFPYLGKCCFASGCEKFKTQCQRCPQVKSYPKSLFFDWSKNIFERKKKIYEGFENLLFVGTKWCVEQGKQSALFKNVSTLVMDYPLDIETFQPRDTKALRVKLGIPENNKIAVIVARASFPAKGGRFFIDLAQKLQDYKEISFVYVGYDVDNWDIPDNVKTIGFVSSQFELSEYLSLGDVLINTSLADLTPLACLEGLGCGTPIAGFAEAGVPDSASPEFGTFVKTYDIDALAEAVLKTPRKTPERIMEVRNYAVERFGSTNIYDRYLEVYNHFDDYVKK